VGIVESGMAFLAPAARCIHLTHDVPPQDIVAGSFALAYALPWLPPDAVVWAVVDPGVGTDRRAVAIEGNVRGARPERRITLVAPDNGLATEALARIDVTAAVALDDPRYHMPGASATFHGRDVFGPAAAWLARGEPLAALGARLDPVRLRRLDLPEPVRTNRGWLGTVRWVDRFGDLVTDLSADLLEQGPWVATVGATHANRAATPPDTAHATGIPARDETPPGATLAVPVGRTFGSVEPGEAVAYAGSWNTVEIAVRDGSAATRFGAGLGTSVALTLDRS
jgi:S-adenosylmethionine hydrolase